MLDKEVGEWMELGVDELYPGLELPSDVFVMLSDNHYVQVAKRGSKSTLQELHAAGKNSNLRLLVKSVDFPKVVEQNVRISAVLLKRPDVDFNKRIRLLRTTLGSVLRQIHELGFDEQLVKHSKQVVADAVNLIQKREDYVLLMNVISELPGNQMKNALAVASLSILVGRALGWSPAQLEKLALGALFRDVGLTAIPEAIVRKPRSEMSSLERMTYENHPIKSGEILRKIPGIPPEVPVIAVEHHENALGLGYPYRTRDFAQSPLSKVVALADVFIELTMPMDHRKPQDSLQALHTIEVGMGLPFNRGVFIALKKALEGH